MDTPQAEPTQRPGRPRSLFDLPDELLIQIVSHLAADQPALCLLARTCRFFQIEAEKHIYTTIELLSTGDLHAIIEAFTRRPERIASVETLKILYRFHQGLGATSEQRNVFNQCVKRMAALRVWEIESPYDNYKWDEGGDEWVLGDMEEFRKALESASLHAQPTAPLHVGLAKLESLTLHTHGVSDDFWDLGAFHCLFRHPSLRHLHVSCLALPPDIPELEPYAKTTPLTSLVFDECELEPRSLGRILATPKNLRHLTLGENVYNVNLSRRTNPRLTRHAEASLAALSHVAHSLESLTHYDPASALDVPSYKHHPLPGPGMRHFHALSTLHVDASSFLHRSIALSHTQAPPNLSTLQIRQPRPLFLHRGFMGAITHADFFETLPTCEPYTYLSSLRTLEFIQGASLEDPTANPHHMCAEEPLRARHAIGYTLFKHRINLKVSLEATWRARLIPPFLHGEPPLRLVNIYDAESVGFKRLRHGAGIVEGDDTAEAEREVETDALSEREVKGLLMEVWRTTNRTFHAMRGVAVASSSDSESESEDGAAFTVVVDDDEDMWEDVEDVDGEDVFWMDADGGGYEVYGMGVPAGMQMEGLVQAVEADHTFNASLSGASDGQIVLGLPVGMALGGEGDVEMQAQALLNAAYAVAQGVGGEDTDTDTDLEEVGGEEDTDGE